MAIALAAARRRLDGFRQVVQARRRSWKVPGVAVGILHGDTPLLAEGFATRRVGRPDLPVTEDSVFGICSLHEGVHHDAATALRLHLVRIAGVT